MKVLNQPKSIKPLCIERERSLRSDHLLAMNILKKVSQGDLENGIRSD